MVKTVFKEVIIILLLCLAILLVLSVLFYDYNPISKVVPNKIAYTVPEGIEKDLEEETTEEEITIENKIYTIEGSDLNIYKKSNSYNPGKANPFSATTMDTNIVDNGNAVDTSNGSNGQTVTEQPTNVGTTTNNNNSGNSSNNVASSTTNTFWDSTGSK